MEPAAALADLTEISSQVRTAVLFDVEGTVLASTETDDARTEQLVATARELLSAAEHVPTSSGRALTQLEVALRERSVFVARDDARAIITTTSADPTAGLVLYDLRACLRAAADAPPRATPRARRPKKTVDA